MDRKWVATLDASGREISALLEVRSSGYRVVLEGEALDVDVAAAGPGRWSLLIEGRSLLVDIRAEANRWTVVGRRAITRMVLENAHRKALAVQMVAHSNKSKGEVMVAPIAGKVIRYFVKVGDEIAPGDPVVALEAMKMENELKAQVAGRVTALHSQVGCSVKTHSKLLTIESQ